MGCGFAADMGIDPERIINTYPADESCSGGPPRHHTDREQW